MSSEKIKPPVKDSFPFGSVVIRLIVALGVATVAGCLAFWGMSNLLLSLDKSYARVEVQEYIKLAEERVDKLKMTPSVYELSVKVLPEDDTRLAIRGNVEDLVTYRLVRAEFDDVNLERFDPVWDLSIQNEDDRRRAFGPAMRGMGAARAYATRSTLSAGVAGICATVVFLLLAIKLLGGHLFGKDQRSR